VYGLLFYFMCESAAKLEKKAGREGPPRLKLQSGGVGQAGKDKEKKFYF